MECVEVEKRIPLFLENKLEERDIREFVEHMETCEECKEELTIHFLASEGVAMIEEGASFDLEKELDARLNGMLKKNETKNLVRMGFLMTEGVAIMIIIAVLLYVFL